MDPLVLPSPCLVVLVGPGASGKSTWAAGHFPPDAIVSSDRLRALVGKGEDDMQASADALALLDDVVRLRLSRRLTTVIDSLGFDADRRRGWLDEARQARVPCVVVTFDTPREQCRAQNRARDRQIPAAVLTEQLRRWPAVRDALQDEGFEAVIPVTPVRLVPDRLAAAAPAAKRQADDPVALRFGLQIGRFAFEGGTGATRESLRAVAAAAEEAGFSAIYVMDHFRQIVQVGREWEDFLESWTTLAYLSACTDTVSLGTLVTGITYRNLGHLAKIVSTLDVLSGGRAVCGLGLAWHGEEHAAYGFDFPAVPDRYELLEDALQVLPMLWGPGSPTFKGRRISVPEAMCYPRPLQEHVPILVGGGGERRTLRLAARYADAVNVFGSPEVLAHKVSVLHRHCEEQGRDPGEVLVTHLSTVMVGADDRQVDEKLDRLRPSRSGRQRLASSVNAGTVDDHVGRCRQLAEAGAGEIIVRLADLDTAAAIEPMAAVISSFR